MLKPTGIIGRRATFIEPYQAVVKNRNKQVKESIS